MEEIKYEKKKSKMLWIIPSILFGIILVSAGVYYALYHTEFTKDIIINLENPDNNGGGSSPGDTTYTITGSGDITDSEIVCNTNSQESCTINGGDISLVNTGDKERTCTLSYAGTNDIENEGIHAIGSDGNTINIGAGSSKIFHIIYTGYDEGTYSVTTIIDCPSS